MAGSQYEFERDVSKWVRQAGYRADAFMSLLVQLTGKELVKISPVDTGFFRASWTAAVNSEDNTTMGGYEGPKGGGESVNGAPATGIANQRILMVAKNAKAGDFVTLSNNAKYGEFLEDRYQLTRVVASKIPMIAKEAMAMAKRKWR